MYVLKRIVLIVAGYAAAALVAATVVQMLYAPGILPEAANLPPDGARGPAYIPDAAIFLGIWFAPPAAICALIAELTSKRCWRYFALSGASIGLAVVAAHQLSSHWFGRDGDYGADNMVIAVMAGALAGVAYWLVAGRSAGQAKP